jgi:hypothetical protein
MSLFGPARFSFMRGDNGSISLSTGGRSVLEMVQLASWFGGQQGNGAVDL